MTGTEGYSFTEDSGSRLPSYMYVRVATIRAGNFYSLFAAIEHGMWDRWRGLLPSRPSLCVIHS